MSEQLEEIRESLREVKQLLEKLERLHEFLESQEFSEGLLEGLQQQQEQLIDEVGRHLLCVGPKFKVLLKERPSADSARRALRLCDKAQEAVCRMELNGN